MEWFAPMVNAQRVNRTTNVRDKTKKCTTNGMCVECVKSTDCGNLTLACVDNKCGNCIRDADCVDERFCDKNKRICLECITTDQCSINGKICKNNKCTS